MAAQQDGVAFDDGDAVTRQEMANLAGVSVDTIKRDVKDHDLTTLEGPNGTVLVLVSQFVGIGRIKPGDVPTGLSGPQAAELRRVVAENARLTALVGELTGRLEESRTSQAVVIAQLGVKDAQIERMFTALGRAGR